VGLVRGDERRRDPDVQLLASGHGEPDPAPGSQRLRFLQLRQLQQDSVEGPRRGLAPRGRRELDVV
jgi:hypothetical protein